MVASMNGLAALLVASVVFGSYTSAFQSPRPLGTNNLVVHNNESSALFSSTTVPERTTDSSTETTKAPLSSLVNRVAVAGATGRTGKFVVQKLLEQNVPVLALVRDTTKAQNVLDPTNELLTIRETDLGNKDDVLSALSSSNDNNVPCCDAAIWCATGFSDAPDQSLVDKLKAVFGLATNKQGTIDAVGVPALGEALSGSKSATEGQAIPKIVMLSSAGVTRPDWDDEKKLALEGAAAIPIVRLNPFGILGVKKESEEKLRASGVDYTIFRPCGLNDKWSPKQRPIFSQGDIAVGRINREDVASILVELLSTPEATGKTFEAVTIANSQEGYYPPAASIGPALSRLALDSDNGGNGPSEDVVRATYAVMQQLLPGEKQEAQLLAMGQTYEQLDKEEEGRLGKRGTEVAPIKPTE